VPTEAELAGIIDGACRDAETFFDIASAVEQMARNGAPDSPLAPFVLAFHYDLLEPRGGRRADYGPYAPVIETGNGAFPPRLETLDASVKEAWARITPSVQEPAAAARLNDLLWVTRHGDQPYINAKAAIAAYVAQAERWRDLAQVECLWRALELSLEINDPAATAEIATLTAAAARAELSESEQKPGVSMRLIEALLDTPAPPAEVDQLLEEAADRYRGNVHVGDSITDLRASSAARDPERVRELRREQMQRWRDHAAAADGLAAIAHLQHGLELARTHGLADEADAFRRALQDFDRESIEFERITAEAGVDREEIEKLLASLVEEDWPSSLRAFGATSPPIGDIESNERFVRQMMKEHPISFLFTQTVLGPENTVIKNVAGDEAHFAAQLTRHESQSIGFWGLLAAEGLRRIRERHGPADHETLAAYFTAGVIAPEYADAFARGVALYGEERYDESALVVVPRIEGVIRELARRAGLVVIREPIGERPGGVRSLNEVLSSLRGILDESWRRYLWNTLAEPLGLNLRNRLAHGLGQGDAVSAALLLHVCCFLVLLRAQPPAQHGDEGPR
jgi:Domain of unknown function (DUF4209)